MPSDEQKQGDESGEVPATNAESAADRADNFVCNIKSSSSEKSAAVDAPGTLDAIASSTARSDAAASHAMQAMKNDNSVKKKAKRAKPPRSRAARITISFTQVIGFSYVALLIALVCMETRLVYPGAYFGNATASQTQNYPVGNPRGVNSVDYTSDDGTELRGRLFERKGGKEYLIFFHGNGSKARWLDAWAKVLSDAFDATVLLAEYRGYEDDATPSENAVIADCQAARQFLCDKYQCDSTDIILYGRSLGGGCAVAMASQGGAKALVLERTFDRLVDVAGNQYPFVPVNLLMRNRYDSVAKLSVYDGPLVMLHGNTDKLIPMENAKRLYDSARCVSKLWIEVPGLGHNDPLAMSDLAQIVNAVEQLTTPATSTPIENSNHSADDGEAIDRSPGVADTERPASSSSDRSASRP